MFPIPIKVAVTFLFVLFLITSSYGEERELIVKVNPGCKNCTVTLIYAQAIGSKDIIHQIWDFTQGMPTVIFMVGSNSSSIGIKWHSTQPFEFELSEQPLYSFGFVIDKLLRYTNYKQLKEVVTSTFPLKDLEWEIKAKTLTNKEAMVEMHSERYAREMNSSIGTINIKLDLLPFKDYSLDLPHLIHTANSTLMDVSLVNMTVEPVADVVRHALHFILASTDSESNTMHYSVRKSLDDEHTPGVFEIIEIKTPPVNRNSDGGYMQFRPVAYTQQARSVANSIVTEVSAFTSTELPSQTTIERFFQNFRREKILVQDMTVSFGEPGEDSYMNTNYTSWSFTVGYGTPPVESFSTLVIVIIAIGLGVPVLLALSGIVFVVMRRCRQNDMRRLLAEDREDH